MSHNITTIYLKWFNVIYMFKCLMNKVFVYKAYKFDCLFMSNVKIIYILVFKMIDWLRVMSIPRDLLDSNFCISMIK